MVTETYRGRTLKARKGREWGTVLVTCNGADVGSPTGTDLSKALDGAKAWIDLIDREPVNGDRWSAHWYAPGTYEMCPEGIHPQTVGGLCQHVTCVAKRAT
jgi:hypothetical protein